MALHGVVRINADDIGWYEIQRLEDVADPDGCHRYRYAVEFTSWAWPVRGELVHRYSDGAAVLLGLVLLAAAAHAEQTLPPPPPAGRETDGRNG